MIRGRWLWCLLGRRSVLELLCRLRRLRWLHRLGCRERNLRYRRCRHLLCRLRHRCVLELLCRLGRALRNGCVCRLRSARSAGCRQRSGSGGSLRRIGRLMWDGGEHSAVIRLLALRRRRVRLGERRTA